MSALLISLLTLVLLIISVFVVLLVLMQRTSQSGGMGAALGGGAAESAFGSDTNNILTKGTIYGIIAFFLVSLSLFLLYQSEASGRAKVVSAGELISAAAVEPAVDVETVTVPESVIAEMSDSMDGTVEAVEESVEVVAPVVDVESSAAEVVPASN